MLELVPAFFCLTELTKKIMIATLDVKNEWFCRRNFYGACNTWLYERYAAVYNREIIACFDGMWSRLVDIIASFRAINFNQKFGCLFVVSIFKYLDYLFVNRGCMAFNWTVALQNEYALQQYGRFIKNYCGRRIGRKTHAQKSYTGKISDIYLYKLTQEDYFERKLLWISHHLRNDAFPAFP